LPPTWSIAPVTRTYVMSCACAVRSVVAGRVCLCYVATPTRQGTTDFSEGSRQYIAALRDPRPRVRTQMTLRSRGTSEGGLQLSRRSVESDLWPRHQLHHTDRGRSLSMPARIGHRQPAAAVRNSSYIDRASLTATVRY